MNRSFLILAGCGSAIVTLLHVVMPLLGPWAYIWFGAGEEFAAEAAANFWKPALITWGITLVFGTFALYAFSAAGLIRSLPFLREGIILIGAIYTLRGFHVVLDILNLMKTEQPEFRWMVFSLVSLTIGLLYLAGAFVKQKTPPAK